MPLSSTAYFLGSASSKDPALGPAAFLPESHLTGRVYGRSHATVWACGKRTVLSGPQLPHVCNRELNLKVFLALVLQVYCLWGVSACPFGHSVNDERVVSTWLCLSTYPLMTGALSLLSSCHPFLQYRPSLCEVRGRGLAQADPQLMGTEHNHISSVGSFENYISSSNKSESANNSCDGFAIRIKRSFSSLSFR